MYYTALIGNPVEHSVSPALFEYLAQSQDMDYRHLKINIEPENLKASLESLAVLSFSGLNVTLPYKQDVIKYMDEMDFAPANMGAVNTITFEDGRMKGWNTDWAGIAEGLTAHGVSTYFKAVVFGSGGAARAAIYALRQLGCDRIFVLHREPVDEKTQKLMVDTENSNVTMAPYDRLEEIVRDADIIMNMSSAGMTGQDSAPFDVSRLDKINLQATVFLDAVFNPVETQLLNYFKVRGLTVIDGLWMMIYQGLAAFELWTGHNVSLTEEQKQEIHNSLKKEVEHDSTRD